VCAEDSSMLDILFFLDRIYPGETPVCVREPCGLFHWAGRIFMIFLFFITSLMKVMNTNPPYGGGHTGPSCVAEL